MQTMQPREYLKENLVPRIRELGFKGSFPHFRRHREDRNELLTFQFNKYGTGEFVIELGVASFGDYLTYFGKSIPPGKLTAHDLGERLRLGAESERDDQWFDLTKHAGAVADQVVELLESKADGFFRKMR